MIDPKCARPGCDHPLSEHNALGRCQWSNLVSGKPCCTAFLTLTIDRAPEGTESRSTYFVSVGVKNLGEVREANGLSDILRK